MAASRRRILRLDAAATIAVEDRVRLETQVTSTLCKSIASIMALKSADRLAARRHAIYGVTLLIFHSPSIFFTKKS